MTGINITMRRGTDPENGQGYYEVQIGPDGHVCSRTRRWWICNDATEDGAWVRADAYKQGAVDALEIAAGLTSRFIRGGGVSDLTPSRRPSGRW